MMLKLVHSIVAISLVSLPAAAIAEKKPKLSGLELQQIQSRDFEVPKSISFPAVMSVLQDDGYRIGAADRDTGLITGIASTSSKMTWLPFVGFGRSKKTPVVSAYIEDRGPNFSRIRLNFVMSKNTSSQFGADAGEKPITDASVYQDAFEKIEKAIFVRQAMDAPIAPAPTPAAAAPAPGSVETAPAASDPTPSAPN